LRDEAGALAKETQGNLGDQQAKDNQDQGAIQALFSFTSSRVCTVLGTPFEGSNQGMIGRVLLLLDSLTCLLSQGEKYFGLCIKHFAGEGDLSTYRRFAPENPVFCFVTFLLVPLDLGLISWPGLIINILRKSAMQRNLA